MRTIFILLLLALASCTSLPKAIDSITDTEIRTLYEVLADDMRGGDLRSMSKHYSRDYIHEDEISRPGSLIRWDLIEYFRRGQGLVNSARSYTIDYRILSIEIDGLGKEAVVISQHYNEWNFGNYIRETESVQENVLVLTDGRILVSRTKVIKSKLVRG